MDRIRQAVAQQDWQQALEISSQDLASAADQFIFQQQCLSTVRPSIALLKRVEDPLFVASICVNTFADDAEEDSQYVELGLSKTPAQPPIDDGGVTELAARLRSIRSELLHRQDLLATWTQMCDLSEELPKVNGTGHKSSNKFKPKDNVDDGWNLDDDSEGEEKADIPSDRALEALPFALVDYLQTYITNCAVQLACHSRLAELAVFLRRHSNLLTTRSHLLILECVPLVTDAVLLLDLLPFVDGLLGPSIQSTPWRASRDWSEDAVTDALHASEINQDSTVITLNDLSGWLMDRIKSTEASGLLDTALALVQHAAARGIPGLDALGQDLSLYSSMVYDASDPTASQTWTLERWRAAPPEDIVQAFMANTKPQSAVLDYLKYVQPYLYVLEAKMEREGRPDTEIHERVLRSYLFNLACQQNDRTRNIQIVAAMIEASKPNLPSYQRLIKYDMELARVVLSLLYGCNDVENWNTFGRIFECLPAFNNVEAVDDAQMIRPANAQPAMPSVLYTTYSSASASQLSYAMDRLDVHLESAEMLARWRLSLPLSHFLAPSDAARQKQLATRLVRHAARADGIETESEDEWEALKDDMLKMGRNDSALSREHALGLLEQHDILLIFFSGLLQAGRFALAKALLCSPRANLSPKEAETLALQTSRELYDNAEKGNMHSGDMKLAYECLNVVPQTPTIKQEREFIEATSRLASYNVETKPGTPLLPIHVRMASDKMSLIAMVIQSSTTAYQYPDVLIDLLRKLGSRIDTITRIRVMLSVAQRAAVLNDYERASKSCLEAYEKLQTLPSSEASLPLTKDACALALRLADNRADPLALTKILGHALLFCPIEEMPDLLAKWKIVEKLASSTTATPIDTAKLNTRPDFSPQVDSSIPGPPATSRQNGQTASQHQIRKILRSAASQDRLSSPSSALDALIHGREGGVRDKLNSSLTSGVSWLIGAEHNEIA